jgi:hypothetical protein
MKYRLSPFGWVLVGQAVFWAATITLIWWAF